MNEQVSDPDYCAPELWNSGLFLAQARQTDTKTETTVFWNTWSTFSITESAIAEKSSLYNARVLQAYKPRAQTKSASIAIHLSFVFNSRTSKEDRCPGRRRHHRRMFRFATTNLLLRLRIRAAKGNAFVRGRRGARPVERTCVVSPSYRMPTRMGVSGERLPRSDTGLVQASIKCFVHM